MLSKYKTIQILLTNVHLDCWGEGSSNRNASRDESVETGDESVETRDESIEAGEKTQQSCYDKSSYFICHWVDGLHRSFITVSLEGTISKWHYLLWCQPLTDFCI